jgi:hypothetical protein
MTVISIKTLEQENLSKKKRRAKSSVKAHAAPSLQDRWQGESRGVEALTVGWMVAAIASFFAILAWSAAWLYSQGQVIDPVQSMAVGYLLIVMLACGSSTLLLGLATRAWRKNPAPPLIRRLALVMGLLPWLLAVLALYAG